MIKLPGDTGPIVQAAEAAPGSFDAVADVACPDCGLSPLRAHGVVSHVVRATDHKHCTEWEAEAVCCGASGFTIGVRRVSLFGFEEDAAVLNGRPRVY